MNWSLIVLIGVVIFFVIAFIYVIFFRPKGRKVYVEIYERYGDRRPVLINPEEKIKGLIYTENGVDKLKMPKRYSKLPLQGPPEGCIINTKSNRDIVRVLRISQDKYVYLEFDLKGTETDYFAYINNQTEPFDWAINELKVLDQRTRNEDKWSKWMPMMVLGVVALGCVMAIYVTAQNITEQQADFVGITTGEMKQDRSFILEAVNNLKEEGQQKDTDTTNRPPGS